MSLVRSLRWAPVAGWCAATATSIVVGSVALTPVLRTASAQDQALPAVGSGSFPAPLPAPAGEGSESAKNPAGAEDGWTVTTAGDGVRTYVRSFRVEGGQAVIRMTSRGVVSLVTATPADGYAVQKVQDSPGNMAVYFNQTNHSFIIHATWWDDRPFAQVSEVGS
jgi:hypothetical protein